MLKGAACTRRSVFVAQAPLLSKKTLRGKERERKSREMGEAEREEREKREAQGEKGMRFVRRRKTGRECNLRAHHTSQPSRLEHAEREKRERGVRAFLRRGLKRRDVFLRLGFRKESSCEVYRTLRSACLT